MGKVGEIIPGVPRPLDVYLEIIEPGDVLGLSGKDLVKLRLYTAEGGHNLRLVLGFLIIRDN